MAVAAVTARHNLARGQPVALLDGGGHPPLAVGPGAWQQVNDIVGAAGAAGLDIGYATVELTSTVGEVWAYASVVDNASGDATTIPILVLND